MLRATLIVASIIASSRAGAGEADVIEVKVQLESAGTYAFDVTVRHADAGWEHYADRWENTGPGGAVYGTRVLAHPHDDEQPFTRSQGGIRVPGGVERVIVRAHDLIHEFGGKEMVVTLPDR
jgi:hypothetical protein